MVGMLNERFPQAAHLRAVVAWLSWPSHSPLEAGLVEQPQERLNK